jgi:hypothetical protein
MTRSGFFSLAFALAFSFAAPAFADEAGARSALAAALASAASEAQGAPRMAFTETIAEKGVVVSGRFDPSALRNARWTPVGDVPPGQGQETYRNIVRNTADERDLLLAKIPGSITGAGRFISETGGIAVFDFAMSPDAHPTNSVLDGMLGLSNHVRVQLSVDVAAGRFSGMRFYAPRAFSAAPLVRVEAVNLVFSFGPSFAGGPNVVRRIDTDARYSIARVANHMQDTLWFKDIAPIQGTLLQAALEQERD